MLFRSNQWTMQSPLNEPRQGPLTCAVDGKYLYCIGGRGKDSEMYSTLEVLDTSYGKLGWSLVQLPETIWKPIYFGLCAPIDNKHILIAGGMDYKKNEVSDTYVLNAENYKIEKYEPMGGPDCFFERDKKVINGKIYAVGYSSFAIHIFDIEKKKWSIIRSANSNSMEENKDNE